MDCFRPLRNERGATLILVAALLIVLMGMAALSVDVGQVFIAKQRAQNVCDAAVMAGARHLTGDATCTYSDGMPTLAAAACAGSNNSQVSQWQVLVPGSDTAGVTVEFPTSVTDLAGNTTSVDLGSAIRVHGEVKVNFAFASALSSAFTTKNVPAVSTAVLDEASSMCSPQFVPLSVSNLTIFGDGTPDHPRISLDPNSEPVLLKTGSWQGNFLGAGNFGAMDLARNGGAGYKDLLAGDNTAPT